MGLIKAITGALGGTLADQWKEFFYCDSLDKEVLVTKGQKRISNRSSNTQGNDNIISNGSGIAVADGQCMIIVEQGKVVEVCAEPGEFTYNSSTEPSIFAGSLGKSILDTFKTIGKRFTYGGDTGKDQRVYYFNTKEILENKFGTSSPVPFRIVDTNIGLDMDVDLRCSGIYSYKITNPLLFYANVCGNVESAYKRSELDMTLKTEFISALQPALAAISELQIRPNAIPAHVNELREALNNALSADWAEKRGISVASIAMNPIILSEEDAAAIKELQQRAVLRDPTMAGATLIGAQAQAMQDAAKNSAGAMTGFMGMGFAQQQSGAVNAASLFEMGKQNKKDENTWKCSCGAVANGKFCPECGAKKPETKVEGEWVCEKCGTKNTGKFCLECGEKKPEDGWKCACGAVNKGKFCSECGAKKPEGEKLYKCDKCGWEPADPAHPPKFCPECGDVFDDKDIK